MKKVYICGPVTGKPYPEVRKQFGTAEAVIKSMGMMPVNPVNLVDPEADWHTAMRICIKALMDADAIMLLDGWNKSKGANVEHELARILELNVLRIEIRQSKMNDEEGPVSELKEMIDNGLKGNGL